MNAPELLQRLARGTTLVLAVLGATQPARALAGGRVETIVRTGIEIAPGIEQLDVAPIFWDERCARVSYTLDTIPPNAGTPEEIDVQRAREDLEASMDAWNRLPSSYIEMRIDRTRTIGNGTRRFDFINEITFESEPGFGALAGSRSTSLMEDTQLSAGSDLDGDGDSDVYDPEAERLNVCADIDGDGDIEFPAGFYRAGTILENDVMFSSTVSFELEPSSDIRADLRAVATHEFGHSHGLSHSLINDGSDTDGNASTMFPFLETTDAATEAEQRTLNDDDIAWSSFIYPEGSGPGPLASIGPGDVRFEDSFGVIEGIVEDETGLGIPGANVFARQPQSPHAIGGAAFAGTVRGGLVLETGEMIPLPPSLGVLDGRYRLPVRRGNYEVFVQSPEVTNAPADNINITAAVGLLSGLHGFDEEGASAPGRESAFEIDPGRSQHFSVRHPNRTPAANFILNRNVSLRGFDGMPGDGSFQALGRRDVVYATRFRNTDVLNKLRSGAVLTSASFMMTNFVPSEPIRIRRFRLAVGRVSDDGSTAELQHDDFHLRQLENFTAQEGDFHPVYFQGASGLSRRLRNLLERDPSLDVFLLLEPPNDVVLPDFAFAPLLAISWALDPDDAFLSVEGSPLQRTSLERWALQLTFASPE